MTVPILAAADTWLEYSGPRRTVHALRGVDLEVEPGEFVGVMGPSGSGKSSLLFVLSGLRPATRGAIRFAGKPWPTNANAAAELRRRHLGFVFCEPFLIPYLTVRENAAAQALPGVAPSRAEELAGAVGLTDLLDERPTRLSAGERQRASVVRALINDPDIILADEPTAHLDRAAGGRVMDLLVANRGTSALLVVSHDERALAGADRVVRLDDGVLIPAG